MADYRGTPFRAIPIFPLRQVTLMVGNASLGTGLRLVLSRFLLRIHGEGTEYIFLKMSEALKPASETVGCRRGEGSL